MRKSIKKILLISPPLHLDSFKAKHKKGEYPTLGLLHIASYLREKGNYDIKVIDAYPLRFNIDELINSIIDFCPDIIGISIMTSNYINAFEFIRKLKETTGILIVVGGPQATAFPEFTIKQCPQIDFLIAGAGEINFYKLVLDINNNSNNYETIPRIYYENNISLSGGHYEKLDLNQLPLPAYDLIELNDFTPYFYEHKTKPTVSMITSRSCPYSKCSYCFSASRLQEKYVRQSPEKLVDNIRKLYNQFKIKQITFMDDVFLASPKWIEKFCYLLKNENTNIKWSCRTRISTITEDVIKKIKDVGCWRIIIGFESGVQELLDIINKGVTVEKAEKAIKTIQKEKLSIAGYFMLGLPKETPEKAKQTIEFAIRNNLDYAQFSLTRIVEGTKLYDIYHKYGKKINKEKQKQVEGVFLPTVGFLPYGYKDEKELEEMMRLAHWRFYFRLRYIIKIVKELNSIENIRRYIALFRVFLRI